MNTNEIDLQKFCILFILTNKDKVLGSLNYFEINKLLDEDSYWDLVEYVDFSLKKTESMID